MNLDREAEFFKDIAQQTRALVRDAAAQPSITKQKSQIGDYATEVDVAVEQLIVAEIEKRFPGDQIMAEEGHADTVIPDGRIWIIDPICGTTNLARGIASAFCTNIALADNHQLIASCVVDHALNTYYWSTGQGKVYCGAQVFKKPPADTGLGRHIEVDLGCWPFIDHAQRERMSKTIVRLADTPGYTLVSLGSSLGFAYVAIGKIDGLLNADTNPWDICASAFLIQQSGGIITALDGSEWQLTTRNTIAAVDAATHEVLLSAYKAS